MWLPSLLSKSNLLKYESKCDCIKLESFLPNYAKKKQNSY